MGSDVDGRLRDLWIAEMLPTVREYRHGSTAKERAPVRREVCPHCNVAYGVDYLRRHLKLRHPDK